MSPNAPGSLSQQTAPKVVKAETVTVWIQRMRGGDDQAIERLWERFFPQLVRLAARRLSGAKRAVADEEDVALSAFNSFCAGAQQGKFPRLCDRDSLWNLLISIVAHKSVDLIRRENCLKRGGVGTAGDAEDRCVVAPPSVDEVVSEQVSPETAAMVAELFQRLLTRLDRADDPDLMVIAVARMRGDSKNEIAIQLECSSRSIERKLKLIHRAWQSENT